MDNKNNVINEGNRVCCLYRVSTEKQLKINANNEADIPVQRRACHEFCEQKGWIIVHEEQEQGVSGYKVHAEDRDKLQKIKSLATQKKFDILLVFMFDRLGRIPNETPFIVEWFVKNGIRVWSTREGEQRFDSQVDSLVNFIRFWQAGGESEKTSVRTKTALGQLVEDGHYKGGTTLYGYDLVLSGRLNKQKQETHDLAVNEAEAAVVRLIFDKYTNEGYGAQRISTWLNNHGYRTKKGECWTHGTIRGMICNPTYTGVLRSGESHSKVIPALQIISPEQYNRAQEIRQARSNDAEEVRTVPLNTKGEALLSGNVFCAHCGSRLNVDSSGKGYVRADGTKDDAKRLRYICYGKNHRRTNCDGQTTYRAHILDAKIDKIVRGIFEKMKRMPKSEIIANRCKQELVEQKAQLTAARGEYTKISNDLAVLKAEVVNAILGKSNFSQEMLSGLIEEKQKECERLEKLCYDLENQMADSEQWMKELSETYNQMISWADLYNEASIETKKMIVSALIKRVDVGQDYKLKIKFNLNLYQFLFGLDQGISA